MSETRI